ncbi:MAG: T9SS type A sorting domain-containing protein [Cyclonatronaceae bacterium]
MKKSNAIPVRLAAGRCYRAILICFFMMLLASGLQAQKPMNMHGNSGIGNGESVVLLSGSEHLKFSSGVAIEAERVKTGLRSWSPFSSYNISTIKRKASLSELSDPMDAREAFDTANAFMTEEDPDARPVNMYGEDSSLFDDFEYKQTADQHRLVPAGESYFWEVAYLNDLDSLIHFALVVGTEVIEYDAINLRDSLPQDLPPIPLSELKSIPTDFISSKAALTAALDNGLDDLLAITELDGWFTIDYNLGGFFFDYPGLLDSDSPVFWDVLFDGHAWDDVEERNVWVESDFLIDALTGNLLGKLVFTSEDDFGVVDFIEMYSLIDNEMQETNDNATLIQAFGSEDILQDQMPAGKSSDWMGVWFDADTELVYMFLTRGNEIYTRNFFPLSDIPEEERPPEGHFRGIDLRFGSEHALTTSLDAGLRQQLQEAPPEAFIRVDYNLHSEYSMFPDILDEESNPFWHLEVEIEKFDEQERIYHKTHNHLVDAVTGEYLGSVTETSAEEGLELPEQLALHQNYPNPFNPETRILWEMNAEQHLTLSVYDLLGQRVMQLADGVFQAGVHSVTFDATELSSGVYIYRLETGGTALNRKMTVLK